MLNEVRGHQAFVLVLIGLGCVLAAHPMFHYDLMPMGGRGGHAPAFLLHFGVNWVAQSPHRTPHFLS